MSPCRAFFSGLVKEAGSSYCKPVSPRRAFPRVWLFAATSLAFAAAAPRTGFESLLIGREEYPKAYFFRGVAEQIGRSRQPDYDAWEKTAGQLMGIEGKALDEEGDLRKNIALYTRFKQQHPEQLVLLHYNGNARDPVPGISEFFAGHWLYFNGSKITSDVPAEEGETDLHVEDPSLFKVNTGMTRKAAEDIGLCRLDRNGKPDWRASEQVKLVSVDAARNTIRVKRAQFGTKALAFAAGKAYAASHVHEGPRGNSGALEWFYNYSTTCPRDAEGRTAADVLVEQFARLFGPGGELASFDGVNFDVLWFNNHYHPDLRNPSSPRGMDADADGRVDRGIVDGINVYGAGVTEFCRKIRAALPAGKVVNADGFDVDDQRSFGLLNGMESEGFPELRDHTARDWSGGLNRLFFWAANARPPVFNYINHKFIGSGRDFRPPVPFHIHRLVFAAATFTNSAICFGYAPDPEPGEKTGIWDELRKGVEHRVGWLGKPLGPAVRLAERQPDVLAGKGTRPEMFSGTGVRFTTESGALAVTNQDLGARQTRFRLKGVKTNGANLYVRLIARGMPLRRYPREIGRLVRVAVAAPERQEFMSWMNERDFASTFYFSGIQTPSVDLEITVEGSEPFWISALTAHAHADAIYREFERGMVLANPSPEPYRFQMAELFRGKSFHRLRGSSRQDTTVNNGASVGSELMLPPKDAIFLALDSNR